MPSCPRILYLCLLSGMFTWIGIDSSFGQCGPAPIIYNGLSLSLPPSGTVNLPASIFDAGSIDECGSGALTFSFSDDESNQLQAIDCNTSPNKSVDVWVTDQNGNQNYASSYLIIQNQVAVCPPSGAGCSPVAIAYNGLSIDISAGPVTLAATDFDAGSLDVCNTGSLTAEVSFSSSNFFESSITFDCGLGFSTIVYLKVTDGFGNQSIVETYIKVRDNQDFCGGNSPISTCGPSPVLMDGLAVALPVNGTIDLTPEAVFLQQTDGCGNGNIQTALADSGGFFDFNNPIISFSCGDQGAFIIRGYIKDNAGNTTYAETFVLVQDNISPQITCVEDQSVDLSSPGTYFISATELVETASDNCQNLEFSFSQDPNDQDLVLSCQDAGANSITIWSTDESGNQHTCSTIITVNCPSSNCNTITDLPAFGEATSAAACLCELGYVTPKNYGGNNTNGVEPDEALYRADLAKLLYYTLYKNGDVSNNPALNFPTPFYDLEAQIFQDQQNSNDPSYYNYGKILSYLEYGDGITPFDRNFLNFNPYQTIQRRYALKALLETLNIAPDESSPSPFPEEINPGDDAYGYVKKAFVMGLIPEGNVTTPVLRRDFFMILHRLIQDQGDGSCTLNYTTPEVLETSYFQPGNLRPEGLSRSIGMTEGYFTHAEKPVFNIPGFNLPLQFQIFHNAYLTELPKSARRLAPLGIGWSHNFNAYMVEETSLDETGAVAADKLFLFWPGGSIHQYDRPAPDATSPQPSESVGVFDQIEPFDGGFRITKKNQVQYIFTEYTVSDGDGVQHIWMLTEIIDRNQNAIVLAVEEGAGGLPRIASVTGTTGSRRLLFTYKNNTNQLVSVEDEAGNRAVAFQFNQSGKLQFYTNPRGHAVQYTYGTGRERNLLKTIRLPRGTEIKVAYDDNLKLASVEYPGMTNPLSVQVSPNYNTAEQYSAAVKHPDFNIETTYQFTDQYNQLAAQAIAQTGVLTTYNTDNLPETIIYGEAVYDSNGELIDINDPVVTQIAYDNRGNVTQLTEALGSADEIQHTFTYTPLNDIATYTDPRNYTTNFVYSNGNIDYIDDNMNFRTDYTVNSRGLVEIVDNPELISTDYDYDAFGNLTSINLPLEISQTITYDPVGRPVQVKNPLEQITTYGYDEHNQVKLVTRFGDQENITLAYNYDPNDHLIDIENAKGNKTAFNFYPDKELLQSVTFGDDATSYTYLDDYRLDYYTKPDGTQMQISYDNQGRIVSDGYVDTYTYDARSNIKTVVKDGLTTGFNYDLLDRIDNYTDIYGQTVDYDYDANGNTTQITYPGGFVVTYEYDANNRLRFTRWAGGTKEVEYTYLKDGRLDRVDYPNGTYCTYNYDAAGRLTDMVTYKSNTTDVICGYTFELDKLGNHLSEQKTEPFGAPTPPMLSAAGTYNDENEVQIYGGESFQFDANGNQTGKGGVAATWDENDMLLSYGTNQYTYDGLGKLRRAVRNGQATRYVWDVRGMGNILVETNDSGTPLYYYIHGLGLVARVNVQTSAEHYYHYDFRGSTVAMTDASETITHSYSYLPFGELAQQQEANANPFRFVGKWGVMAEGNDLYYMRARYYDAQTGRFLSEDPVWGDNLYGYGGNNPIVLFDPNGNSSIEILHEAAETLNNNSGNGAMFTAGANATIAGAKAGLALLKSSLIEHMKANLMMETQLNLFNLKSSIVSSSTVVTSSTKASMITASGMAAGVGGMIIGVVGTITISNMLYNDAKNGTTSIIDTGVGLIDWLDRKSNGRISSTALKLFDK